MSVYHSYSDWVIWLTEFIDPSVTGHALDTPALDDFTERSLVADNFYLCTYG